MAQIYSLVGRQLLIVENIWYKFNHVWYNKLTNTLTRLQNALFDIMEHIHRQNGSGTVS